MRLKKRKECLFFLLFAFLIFGIFQYSIHKIFGMVYFPDEFGYWASAAKWNGYDWSSLTALGSYYSFGYSILLAPILRLGCDGVTAYRTAVALNMLLQALAAPMLYGIFRRIFPASDRQPAVCAVGIALFYPVWIFYAQVTLAEGLLFFLYIGVIYLLARTVEKARPGTILLLSAALVYLYFVHMRTVGVLAAAVLVLLCWLWQEPAYRRRMLIGFGVLAVGGILGIVLRLVVIGAVYGNTEQEMLAANDLTGQLSRVAAVFSAEGIVRFFCGSVGKLFYLGASSFGTVYYALVSIGKTGVGFLRKLRHKEKIRREEWLSLFLLFSFAGQFLITAVYMNEPRRADEVVYGRYNDYLLPVFMGTGFLVMYRCRRLVRTTVAVTAVQTAMLPVVLYGERLYGGSEIQGYFMAGIAYLVDDLHFEALPDLTAICLLADLMIVLFSVLVWLGREKKLDVCVMALVVFAQIMLGFRLHHKYTYLFNELIYREVQLSGFIGQKAGQKITCLYEGGTAYIDVIQFNLPQHKIDVITEKEMTGICDPEEKGATGTGEYLLLDIDSTWRERVGEYWTPCAESACFAVYERESVLDFSD